MIDLEEEKLLIEKAIEASKESYSPYSNFRVGAALLSSDGKLYTGCNVENASYGGGICAERTAAVKAISNGSKSFIALAVYGGKVTEDGEEPQYAHPCGICRQFIREFAVSDMVVIVGKSPDDYQKYRFKDLLPHSFGPENLDKPSNI